MEYLIGYLVGSGADWPTVIVTLLGALVIAVIAKAIFGDR